MRGYILLFAILLIPGVQAQNIYSEQHNLTYYLNDALVVEEDIKLVLKPFSVKNPLYYTLPEDSSSIVIEAPKRVRYTLDFDRNIIVFDFSQVPVNSIYLQINYTRINSIFEENGEKSYSGLAFRKFLPWVTYNVDVKFIIPEGYDFGSVTPASQTIKIGSNKALEYKADLRFNFTTLTEGMPVEITYANYRKLAEAKLTVARSRESGVLLAFRDANESLENAMSYNLNLSEELLLYREAEEGLYNYFKEVEWAEALMSSKYRDYYLAYQHAKKALALLENASIKSREVNRRASLEVQRYLERKILEVSNFTTSREEKKPVNVTPPVTQPPATPQPEETPSGSGVLYILLFPVLLGLLIVIYIKSRPRPIEVRRTSRVRDFRVISDLKRKKFSGFDKKVEIVKESVDVAAEIRKLSKLRSKYELGIENLKKRLASGEISEIDFKRERDRYDKEIEQIDLKIGILKKRLADLKKKKSGERRVP